MTLLKLLCKTRSACVITGIALWTVCLLAVGRSYKWTLSEKVSTDAVVELQESRNLASQNCSIPPLPTTQNKGIAFSVRQLKTPPFLPGSMYRNPCWLDSQEKGRLMCLPYVFFAGFPKCASTDLYARVVAHPMIIPSAQKEPHYWQYAVYQEKNYSPCLDDNTVNSSTSCLIRQYSDKYYTLTANDITINRKWAEYATDEEIADARRSKTEETPIIREMWDRFKEEWTRVRQEEQQKIPYPMVTVDGTTGLAYEHSRWRQLLENQHQDEPLFLTPDVMHQVNPQAKVVMIMRNPVTRAFSSYTFYQTNHSVEEFHEWVVRFIEKFEECLKFFSLRFCTYESKHRGFASGEAKVEFEAGLYYIHVSDWLERFPRENFMFIRTESYHQNMTETLAKLYAFLGLPELSPAALDAIVHITEKNVHKEKKADYGPMWPETKEILTKFYADYNRKLADLLGDERFTWQDVAH